MTPDFWVGRKVLLTGHTGFKGAWLSLWLQKMGAVVSGFSLAPPTSPSLFELADVSLGMSASLTGDVRDSTALNKAFALTQPEIAIHMAAQPLVRQSYKEPVETYSTNVMGTVNFLEAVRQTPSVRSVVIVTTDKCYENQEWDWGYREIDRLGGHDPYSNSKACAELVTSAYLKSYFPPEEHSSHGVSLASARAGNVIGGGDFAKDRLVPDILRAFKDGAPVDIRHPGAIRPWQHVLEPLRGYLLLAQQLSLKGPMFSGAWNFGPDAEDALPVGEVANRMALLWQSGSQWRLDDSSHPHEANFLKLDTSKAHNRLGWKPKISLQQALELTVKWAKACDSGENVRELTFNQIEDYTHI